MNRQVIPSENQYESSWLSRRQEEESSEKELSSSKFARGVST